MSDPRKAAYLLSEFKHDRISQMEFDYFSKEFWVIDFDQDAIRALLGNDMWTPLDVDYTEYMKAVNILVSAADCGLPANFTGLVYQIAQSGFQKFEGKRR